MLGKPAVDKKRQRDGAGNRGGNAAEEGQNKEHAKRVAVRIAEEDGRQRKEPENSQTLDAEFFLENAVKHTENRTHKIAEAKHGGVGRGGYVQTFGDGIDEQACCVGQNTDGGKCDGHATEKDNPCVVKGLFCGLHRASMKNSVYF